MPVDAELAKLQEHLAALREGAPPEETPSQPPDLSQRAEEREEA